MGGVLRLLTGWGAAIGIQSDKGACMRGRPSWQDFRDVREGVPGNMEESISPVLTPTRQLFKVLVNGVGMLGVLLASYSMP
jgi:hypothetical protein